MFHQHVDGVAVEKAVLRRSSLQAAITLFLAPELSKVFQDILLYQCQVGIHFINTFILFPQLVQDDAEGVQRHLPVQLHQFFINFLFNPFCLADGGFDLGLQYLLALHDLVPFRLRKLEEVLLLEELIILQRHGHKAHRCLLDDEALLTCLFRYPRLQLLLLQLHHPGDLLALVGVFLALKRQADLLARSLQ